jgi:prepilin-type processing-associated H-X9-DG protein
MRKTAVEKRDVLVALGCVVFLLANLGAVGSGGRRRAKEAVCVSNLKRWGTVWKAFVDDNEGHFTEETAWGWHLELEQYYENRKLLLCPEAARPYGLDGQYYGGKFNAWADDEDGQIYVGSYGVNQYCSLATGGGRTWEELWKTPYVGGAASVPLMLDSANVGLTPTHMDIPPDYDGQIYFASPANIDEIRSFCLNRHNAAVNVLFLDFSVRKVGLKYLWLLDWHRDWPIPETMPLPVWPAWMANFKDP